jgi:hypothetical protein
MNEEKKNFIPGIYNYCDRWCEKCRFTSNCHLYTTESRITSHQLLNNGEMPKAEDIYKTEDFADTEEDENIFDEMEDDFFIDSDVDTEEFDEEFLQEDFDQDGEKELRRIEQNKTPIEKFTQEYLDKSHKLVKKVDEKYNLYQPPKEKLKDPAFKKLYDNFDVFCYYHMFIHVKFKRAIHGKEDIIEEDDDEMKEIHAYDMNGTAKIATISVNNSISALNELYKLLPEYNTEIGELLVLLGKIKNEAEIEFPDCMSFVRPGLDE